MMRHVFSIFRSRSLTQFHLLSLIDIHYYLRKLRRSRCKILSTYFRFYDTRLRVSRARARALREILPRLLSFAQKSKLTSIVETSVETMMEPETCTRLRRELYHLRFKCNRFILRLTLERSDSKVERFAYYNFRSDEISKSLVAPDPSKRDALVKRREPRR